VGQFRLPVVLLALLVFPATLAGAAPEPDLWPRWEPYTAESSLRIDHSAWDRFLKKYVATDSPSGIYRVRYSSVTEDDRSALTAYVASLALSRVSDLSRLEQKAYWINLYNALTVKVVLDHYPVKSIRDIRSGWFVRGPWDLKLVKIAGVEISLNDIEHRILRPIFRDNRVHYGVNCASLGCPNLQREAFTAENTERLLTEGARAYVNHPRGARVVGETILVSSIYDWFQEDFGGSEEGVLHHLKAYASARLAEELTSFRGKMSYAYDWSLNE
jgi:hypothetical protein